MATFTVTTTADSGAGSLRQAVLDANANAGADVIDFDGAVFDGEAADIIRLTSGQIDITGELAIVGGPAGVTITGDAADDDVTIAGGITDLDASREDRLEDNSRIFDATADLTLDGLTLTGGRTTFSDDDDGGAVRGTTVTLIDGTISGNYASGGGGGVSAVDVTIANSFVSGNYTYQVGGGVSASGMLSVNASTISDNVASAFYNGGGLWGQFVSVEDSTVTGNYSGVGGGVWGRGVRVINSVVSDTGGGGISAGDVYVAGSTISGNSGGGIFCGGPVYGSNSTISGNTNAGNAAAGYFGYATGGGIFSYDIVTLNGCTVSGNSTTGEYVSEGGGIWAGTSALANSVVLGNSTNGGAGDEVFGALSLTGGNIVGADIFDGAADVGDVTAAEVFAATVQIAPGVFAGALSDNGGPTQTIALRLDASNPAIGGADPATVPPTDQRGVPRGPDPDLGAFEAGPLGGLTIVGGPKADVLTGTAFADKIFGRAGGDTLRGLLGDDLLKGEQGCDALRGDGGRDALFGGCGGDRLTGGTGFDALWGGGGVDRLTGGTGFDALWGGGEVDVFVFGPGFGCDRIGDFDANPRCGQDKIDLRGLGITATSFDDKVTITDLGPSTRVKIVGYGTIFCEGVTGEGANALDRIDFLL